MSGVDGLGWPKGSGSASEPCVTRPGPAPAEPGGGWNIPDSGTEDTYDPSVPLGGLVTFHYLRAAVRRRWLRTLLFGLVGLLLGAGFLVTSPPTATTTLLLNRVAKNDGSSPMATDLSLLTTRAVAERTIAALGLQMTPEDLLGTVHAVTTDSPDVLQLTMTASTTAEARRRLERFSQDYLQFRAAQVTAQSGALIDGYDRRIADLQSQLDDVNKRIQQLGTSGGAATDRLAEALTSRSNLSQQISAIQSQKQDVALQQNAIEYASRVIDPAAAVPPGGRRHLALVLASGLVAGLAVGIGVTVLQAILSDRLWLREEVASALDARVTLSVRGRVRPRRRWLAVFSFLPWIGSRLLRRRVDLLLVAHAIARAVPEAGSRQSLAVLCLDNSDDMRFAVVAAAAELRRRGTGSTVVDLTQSGRVQAAARRLSPGDPQESPEVFRPSVVPSLVRGPSELESADWDDVAMAKARNGVTLVIADADPAVGADYLTAWSNRVVVAVTAGRSSVGLVRTTAELVRDAGLRLEQAVLLRARRDDISSGVSAPRDLDLAAPASGLRPDPAPERSYVQ